MFRKVRIHLYLSIITQIDMYNIIQTHGRASLQKYNINHIENSISNPISRLL